MEGDTVTQVHRKSDKFLVLLGLIRVRFLEATNHAPGIRIRLCELRELLQPQCRHLATFISNKFETVRSISIRQYLISLLIWPQLT